MARSKSRADDGAPPGHVPIELPNEAPRGVGSGRKTILWDGKLRDTVLAMIRTGMPLKYAADAAGINRGTITEWLRKGQEGTEPYATFADEVKRARGEGMGTLAARIFKASEVDWKAAHTLLASRYPHIWSLRRNDPPAVQAPAVIRILGPDDPEPEADATVNGAAVSNADDDADAAGDE